MLAAIIWIILFPQQLYEVGAIICFPPTIEETKSQKFQLNCPRSHSSKENKLSMTAFHYCIAKVLAQKGRPIFPKSICQKINCPNYQNHLFINYKYLKNTLPQHIKYTRLYSSNEYILGYCQQLHSTQQHFKNCSFFKTQIIA